VAEFELTDEQEAVLEHDFALHARILAGPGTGKSTTLVALISQLLQGKKKAPRARLLTFTRAATAELAEKLSKHPAALVERPSTIHSFAISVLLRNTGAGDLPRPLRIADDWEYANVVRPTLARRAGVHQRRLDRLVRELAANWESLRRERDPEIKAKERARFMGAWREHRGVYGYTLLAELPNALRGALRDHPALKGLNYDALIVDEYQDLNACDLEVLRLLAERGCSIIGAGDDEQSIYSFRKAAPEGILRFLDDYPGAADYPLSVTQRCAKRIVEWANYVIVGDPDRDPKRPVLTSAASTPDGEVALLAFSGEGGEARGVGALVENLVVEEEVPPNEILVLLRGDYGGLFSRPIKRDIESRGIEVSDPDEVDRMLENPDNRWLLEVLRLLVYQNESIAWASLLLMTDGIGPAFIDYVYDRARRKRIGFGRKLLDLHAGGLPDAPHGSGPRARALIDTILPWLGSNAVPDDIPGGGWGAWIVSLAGTGLLPEPTDELQALFKELDSLAEPAQDLGRYLGQIQPLGKDLAMARSDGVRVMTMTGAKGLTVQAAILVALEDNIIPRPDVDLGEERRLLYVAMTRARTFLFGTWARRRTGPTARSGAADIGLRHHTQFLDGGPVASEDGPTFLRRRWG